MALPVLTAVSGAPWEAALVGGLEGRDHRIEVVRRCVDLADLLGAAGAGLGRAVLLSADLRRLDRDAVTRLRASGVAVVGVVAPGDPGAAERLAGWGVAAVVGADEGTAAIVDAVVRAVAALGADPAAVAGFSFSGGHREPAPRELASGPAGAPDGATAGAADYVVDGGPPSTPGRVVAVWGPTGGPGRTTVATCLGSEFAALGAETLLVDADVYGGTVATHLGVLDESPGLAAATRSANAGGLDHAALVASSLQVSDRLSVLTGPARADRWPEIRPASLEVVLALARSVAAVTVVDCGFCLEEDEELSFDTVAPRRNGATLTALAAADTVLAVGAGDPVGLQRLVRGLDELGERLAPPDLRVVVNRVRRGPVGADPVGQISAALQRFAGVTPVAFLPEDREACDAALLRGRTVTEAAPDSRLRKEVAALARLLAVDVPGVEPARRARR